jgi:hypothetical protein
VLFIDSPDKAISILDVIHCGENPRKNMQKQLLLFELASKSDNCENYGLNKKLFNY